MPREGVMQSLEARLELEESCVLANNLLAGGLRFSCGYVLESIRRICLYYLAHNNACNYNRH